MANEICEKDERPDEDWPGYSEDGHDFMGPWNGRCLEPGDKYYRI